VTAARGGARGMGDRRPGPDTGDGRPGVTEPDRPRAGVGDQGPEWSTMGDGQRPVVHGAAAAAHSHHGGGHGGAQ
jgi:hypothetical protein